MERIRTALAILSTATTVFIVTAVPTVVHARNWAFTLVNADLTNGGWVCTYSNGEYTIRQFRPASAGYCPFNPS